MQFDITIPDLAPLMDRCKEAGANAAPLVDAAIYKSAVTLQSMIRTEAPHRTGALQRSILVEKGDMMAVVSANVKYALYVEEGTRPHQILPKNKKALFWKGALNPYAAVNHPGTKANPFFQRGIEMSADEIQGIFQTVKDQIIAQLGGV